MVLSREDAAHLMRRVCVGGGSDEEIEHFTGMTRAAAVDELIAEARTAAQPPPPDWTGLAEGWEQETETISWWLDRMMFGPSVLREKLAWFWHGHFCTEQDKVFDMPLMLEQNTLFRTAGMGEFSSLVKAMAVQPAMLIYLDNETNEAGAEQENFARELMELFTLGRQHYTEADVVAMAKAWTGHNTVGWVKQGNDWVYVSDYVFRSEAHDASAKTLFGITRAWNGPETIDEICTGSKAVQCSEFVAAKLWRFLAHPDPSPALVQTLGAHFRSVGLDVGELVRFILAHDEFWAPASRLALLRSPVEFLASLIKRTGLEVSANSRRWYLSNMGQVPFDPPNVAGWGQNEDWVSTANAWGKGLVVQNARWHMDDLGHLLDLRDLDAPAVADRIFDLLAITEPSARTRTMIETWVQRAHAERVSWAMTPQGFVLGALAPDFQLA